jgi:SanA protein
MFQHLKKHKGKYIILTIFLAGFIFLITHKANQKIIEASENFITSDIRKVIPLKVALLLGTSKYLKSGKPNAYFFNRIEATIALFKNHKISYVIISGDNSRKDYNEPLDMKNELLKNGIAEDRIYLDYAGFRTYDSVIRAKKIFGQDTILFISQEFHNQRAVFIARQNGIEGYGFNAKDVTAFNGLKTMIREFFARDKVFIDAWINKEPKFLGEKIIIP